jgi:hypothetical protein
MDFLQSVSPTWLPMPQSSEIVVNHRQEAQRVAAYQPNASYLKQHQAVTYLQPLDASLTACVMALLAAAFAVNSASRCYLLIIASQGGTPRATAPAHKKGDFRRL